MDKQRPRAVVFDVAGTIADSKVFLQSLLSVLVKSGKIWHASGLLRSAVRKKRISGTGSATAYIYNYLRRLNVLGRFVRVYGKSISKSFFDNGYREVLDDLRQDGVLVFIATTGHLPKNLRDPRRWLGIFRARTCGFKFVF